MRPNRTIHSAVYRLTAERQRLTQRLAEVDRQLRLAERAASDALGFGVVVRGPQLLAAIEREKGL